MARSTSPGRSPSTRTAASMSPTGSTVAFKTVPGGQVP
jgi:hypothetical protein